MRHVISFFMIAVLVAGCASFGNLAYKKKAGLYVEHDGVETFCLGPRLRMTLGRAERHFRKPVVVTSGYRTPWHNAKVNGASSSYHMKCMAADIFIPGVSKSRLIAFMKNDRGVGGLGCYPGRKFIHVDVRDRPSGYRGPVTFSGC